MKNSLLLLFVLIACNTFGQRIEWEILQGGYTFGFHKLDKEGYSIEQNWFSVGSEVRVNLMQNRLSPGFQFTIAPWERYLPFFAWNSKKEAFSFTYLAVCDYNFLNVNRRIMPYAGMGIGFSRVIETYKTGGSPYSHWAWSPRIGVEILNRLRVSAEYKYIGNRNSFFCLKAGFTLNLFK